MSAEKEKRIKFSPGPFIRMGRPKYGLVRKLQNLVCQRVPNCLPGGHACDLIGIVLECTFAYKDVDGCWRQPIWLGDLRYQMFLSKSRPARPARLSSPDKKKTRESPSKYLTPTSIDHPPFFHFLSSYEKAKRETAK